MTETAPSCTFALGAYVKSGHIGLPAPGVEVQPVPVDGKLEVRFKGSNVMPGYWRAPAETAAKSPTGARSTSALCSRTGLGWSSAIAPMCEGRT